MKDHYHYTESGLANVWLANGFVIHKTSYGDGVSIHDVAGLHRVIAKNLISKPQLTGAEVRFLRKEMGLSQRNLGELLGVSEQAVSLWERRGRIPKTADFLLRLIYIDHDGGGGETRKFIEQLNDLDQQEYEAIIAEESSAGIWETCRAA